MTSIGVIFTSKCHTKQLNPWPNSSSSRVVIPGTAGYLLAKKNWGHLQATQALVDARQA